MEKHAAAQQSIRRSRIHVLAGAWVPPAFWMLFIFFLSGRHSVTVSPEFWLNFIFFKSLHLIEYAVLFALFSRALRITYPDHSPISLNAAAFALTVGYAFSDEFHQLSVPSRTGRFRDVIIDGIGAALSWIILVYSFPVRHKKPRNSGIR